MFLLQQKVAHFDQFAFRWFHSQRYALQVARVSRWVSRLGDGGCYLVLGIALMWLDGTRGETFLLTGLCAYAIELPLYLLLKNTIKRDRPGDKLERYSAFIEPSDKFSFPSGHSAAAFVFAGLLAAFYPVTLVPGLVFAAAVGFSRVLLGVHFPTDIVAGALLGLSSVWFALLMMGV